MFSGLKEIYLLRMALASIWTEAERDAPPEELLKNCQRIADEALELTKYLATAKDLTNDGIGLEGWVNHLGKR